jgi:uncharacterized protein YjdB
MMKIRMTHLLAALTISACTTGTSVPVAPNEPPPEAIRVVGVRVTPQSVQLHGVGDQRQLVVSVVPEDATDRAVRWESTDSSVVSVDGAGRLTARRFGFGVIVTAFTHDGGFQSSTNVLVVP